MCCFQDFLKEVYLNTGISFIVKLNNKEVFNSIDNKLLIEHKIVANVLEFNNKKISIITLERDENCIPLLIYLIKENLNKASQNNEKLIRKILKGEIVDYRLLEKEFSKIGDKFYIINIILKNNNLIGGKELIDALYKGVTTLIVEDHIVILGNFDYISDHMISLKDSIESNLYSECYISYKKLKSLKNIKECFEVNEFKLDLAIRYELEENVYGEKDLFFECVIDKLDENIKSRILKDIEKRCSKLDDELVRTIDILYKSGMNLSEASKMLYIHRNTLLYRIDKIQKYTTYDIRNFQEAIDFKIIFSIWRENKRKISLFTNY